jgi:tetratricopeptide (TPR) repeat protein
MPGQAKLYWGEDSDDRIFHAGVKQMRVAVVRDGFVETERTCDFLKDGAEVIGNATAEEFQFVTSVVGGELQTERVIRHGATTGRNARAMTQRELDKENVRREKAAKMAVAMAEDMIKIVDKDGNEVAKKEVVKTDEPPTEEVEEVFASMSKTEIDYIVADCEQNKGRGNEAFAAGEYGQSILLYTLTLDKADELPDKGNKGDKQLFPRHMVLSNRSAAFLKLGDHEKALADATKAQETDPTYVKGVFRRGLALHAMGRYQDAIGALAAAHKIEPKNKQIKQALQFAEVRMTQEMRKRMGQ